MNVLDPFEVADIEMWPLWGLEKENPKTAAAMLNAAEYTVFQRVLNASSFKAVLNEKDMSATRRMKLPSSVRVRIIPEDMFIARQHADVRIARRASMIANLAKVISERKPSVGLGRTLLTQARRLENLSRRRLEEFRVEEIPLEKGDET